MRRIALLGSTGSIGTNTMEVVAANPDTFRIIGLVGGENIPLLTQQIQACAPEIVGVKHKRDIQPLAQQFPNTRFVHGRQGLLEVVSFDGIDTMISAIDGTTALEATMESIKRGHRICLANKETLVAAGQLINDALQQSTSEIIPIDSEQSAIFQCLDCGCQSLSGNREKRVQKVILTASGGPFFRKKKEEFNSITVKEALNHPTWTMGTKVTIDSATLMNKALEMLEAFYLFGLRDDQVDVVIHPQSIVHSMVEYIDGSIIAQLSVPDMKLPILYSLSYPQRIPFSKSRLSFTQMTHLEFHPVDRQTFTPVSMALHAMKQRKNAGAVLNAANEVAVDAFLQEKISFSHIFSLVEHIFYSENFHAVHSVEDINETINETKHKTDAYLSRCLQKGIAV